jgi:hypothetical protein
MRFAVGQNLRSVVVDLDQILRETVRAIDVVDKTRKFVVCNRVLIIFEYAPFRLAAEDTKIIGGRGEAGDD